MYESTARYALETPFKANFTYCSMALEAPKQEAGLKYPHLHLKWQTLNRFLDCWITTSVFFFFFAVRSRDAKSSLEVQTTAAIWSQTSPGTMYDQSASAAAGGDYRAGVHL